MNSLSYSCASSCGSVFKLITAYAALKEQYLSKAKILNPLTIYDELYFDNHLSKTGSLVVAKTLDNKPYPRYYKGGRLPKSAHRNIGKIDLIGALEQSSNPYFSILSKDVLKSPKQLLQAAQDFNFGSKTEIDLLGETSGRLPQDLDSNVTGLYSFAIGHHTFLCSPLQLAIAFAAIANGGKILKPQITQNFSSPIVQRELFFPEEIRNLLLRGMHKVISGEKGSAKAEIIKKLRTNPSLLEEYKNLNGEMIGKTGTAEFSQFSDKVPSSKPYLYKNLWFAGLSFDPKYKKSKSQMWQHPELVVVVFLRYGDGGKEAAPLAYQIVKKYRQICEKNQKQLEFYR